MNTEVTVIGGGIIGCSIAYYLAQANINVTLFEEQKIASQSTSAAAGMLGAHSELDEMNTFYSFARHSQLTYQQLHKEIQNNCGINIEHKSGGILQLVYSEQEKQALTALLSLPTVTWYEAKDVFDLEPSIAPHIVGAAYIKDDVNVLPTSVCQGFAKSAQCLGAAIYEYTSVFDIQKQANTYSLYTTKGMFQSKYVVIANGVWSTSFFQKLGLSHTITPVKGECISVHTKTPTLTHTLFHNSSYIVPRNNGELVIGATMAKNDWSREPSVGGIEKVIAKAKTMLPNVEKMTLQSCWAGLRPETFDGKPFIGPHPEDDSLFFATGHYRNGILLAPATGQMIRDFILQHDISKEWKEAFRINRSSPTFI